MPRDITPDAEPRAWESRSPEGTFVIRIWATESAEGLRGQVQHVRSRKRVYFSDPERLLTFIQERLTCPS